MGTFLVLVVVFFFGGKNFAENLVEKSIQKESVVVEETKEEKKQEQEVQGVKIENQVSFESSTSPSPQVTPAGQAEFVYPGSSQIGEEGSFKVYKSSDSAESITKWYEDQIDKRNLGATSIVRTETNGNILNKLSAASPDFKIEVEITSEGSGTLIKLKN